MHTFKYTEKLKYFSEDFTINFLIFLKGWRRGFTQHQAAYS